MPRQARCLIILATAFACACATPSPLVRIADPKPPLEDGAYAGETAYLRSFTVKSKEARDTPAEKQLRSQFIEYLVKVGKFARVIDATDGATAVPADALSLAVELRPSLMQESNAMKNYFQIYTAGIFTSRSGTVTVAGNMNVLRGRKVLGEKSWTCNESYAFSFFGWVRTEPIRVAYRSCYEDVFARISMPSRNEGGGISQTQLDSMVKASVEKATKPEEKVYDSDVDKASYKNPENADAFAVVVGIERYQQLPQADFGERDGQTVRDHLVAMGFPPRNVVQLSGSMATKSSLEKYLELWLPEKVNERSKVVFYFSGHGAPDVDSKQAFLMPWDGDVKFLQQSGYPLKRLYASLRALKARQVLVALDSCFSGAGGRSVLPKGARPLVTKVDEGAEGMGRLVILSASEGDEISLSDEKQGHGLFTYHLLKGLNEKNGRSTVKGLYDYLVPRVQDGARQQNRDQTPRLITSDAALSAMTLGD
ncbi:MAG: caspase family protein [Elusimicrobiota bacterium]